MRTRSSSGSTTPWTLRKIANQNLYTVKNRLTGEVHSKGSTLTKAKMQVRILNHIEKLA